MTNPVSNSNSLPNYDGFSWNALLPDMQMPDLSNNLLFDLIGMSDPTMQGGVGDYETRVRWEQEYQSIVSKGDGNAAVAHIVKGLKEGLISKEEAIALAQQVQQQANAAGGGRINDETRQALKDALGTDIDHISKGKTRGQLGWDKFWKGFKSIFGF